MLKKIIALLPLLLAASLLAACAYHQPEWTPPLKHPEDAGLSKRPPICTDCHDAKNKNFNRQRFNHDPYWGENHRQQAYQNSRVCSMCHEQSYCNDCHATRVELKPSRQEPDGHVPSFAAPGAIGWSASDRRKPRSDLLSVATATPNHPRPVFPVTVR